MKTKKTVAMKSKKTADKKASVVKTKGLVKETKKTANKKAMKAAMKRKKRDNDSESDSESDENDGKKKRISHADAEEAGRGKSLGTGTVSLSEKEGKRLLKDCMADPRHLNDSLLTRSLGLVLEMALESARGLLLCGGICTARRALSI